MSEQKVKVQRLSDIIKHYMSLMAKHGDLPAYERDTLSGTLGAIRPVVDGGIRIEHLCREWRVRYWSEHVDTPEKKGEKIFVIGR